MKTTLVGAALVGTAAAWWLDDVQWRVLAGLLALGILALSWLPASRLPASRNTLLVALAVASVAQATAVELWRFVSSPRVRVWNVYHYYLGAKYFEELGYEDLYVATLAADEDGYWRKVRTIRDQATYDKVPRGAAVAAYRPLDHFSEARWRSFTRDVAALAPQRPPPTWRGIFHDRGYNPSPAWTLVGGMLARAPAGSLWWLKAVCALDILMLAVTFWLLARAFGVGPAAWVALLLTLTPVNEGRWIGGFLQYDWFCALATGFVALRRGRPAVAGGLMAYAVATRIFPVILIAAAAVPVVRRYILFGSVAGRHLRFFAAAAIVTLGLIGASSWVYGFDSWHAFASNIEHHNAEHRFGDQRVGLGHLFTHDIRGLDFEVSNAERRALFEAQSPIRVAVVAVVLGLWLVASWRRSMPDALLLGVVPFFALAISSRYYLSCVALLPLLASAGARFDRRARAVTGLQIVTLVIAGLYSLGTRDAFARYSVLNLLLLAFFVLLAAVFIASDLAVVRRQRPLASWHRSAALTALIFGALFAMLCWLRSPVPSIPIRDVDESVSALIAGTWLEGGVPYRDAIDQRGPVTYALYAAVFAVAGVYNMQAVHGLLLMLVLAAAFVTYRIARRGVLGPSGAAIGFVAAFLVATASFSYRRSQMLAFHTEWPMMLAVALAMLLVWHGLRRRVQHGGGRSHAIAGGLFAIAFLSKQPGIFDAGAAAVFVLLWQHRRGALLSRETVRVAGLLAAGFFGVLAACGAYFALAGAWADFVYYYWTYNVEHYTAVVPMSDRLSGLDPFAHRRHYLTANPLLLVGGSWTIAVALGGWIRRRRTDLRLLVAIWLVFAYFGASYSGRNFGHYFIQIIPAASLAAAFMIHDLWRLTSRIGRRWPAMPDLQVAARGAIILGVALAVALPIARFGDDIAWRKLWREPGSRGSRAERDRQRLLEAIRARSSDADSIFVWGYYPELYVLAPRRPASRYSNTNYLTGLLPWANDDPGVDTSAHIVPGAWEILMAELEASRPRLVVDTAIGGHRAYGKYPVDGFPRLAGWLDANYRLEERVDDERGRPMAGLWARRE